MSIGYFIFGLYAIAIVHMHYRGSVRFPWSRQILTHTNYLAPYNLLMDSFSALPNKPLLEADSMPNLTLLRDNWEVMRDEAMALAENDQISASTGMNDAGFNSFFRTGWKRFYIKWYNDYHPSALEQCPKTVEILKQVPEVKAAMFASLPGGATLKPHRDPFAGSLRYHLGLVTPNDDDCYILVDGEKHSWRDGKDVLFDETFIHEAHNKTEKPRIIFFADIRRPMRNRVVNSINSFVSNTLMKASGTQNVEGEKVGAVNHLFEKLYNVRIWSRQLKKWNRKVYYIAKYVLFFGIIYFVFLH